MAEALKIPGPTVTPVNPRSGAVPEPAAVGTRAGRTPNPETSAMDEALNRLDRALSSGRPLRSDVPRGYYLNIRI